MKGYVYLLCDPANDSFKIGVTTAKDIDKRIKELQTGNSTPIHCVNKYETDYPFFIERNLHLKYSKFKTEAQNEWFYLSIEQIKLFITYCKEIEQTINALKDNPFMKKLLR